MPDMDQGIKRLVQTHPKDLLALVLPEAEYLGTLPVDLATEPQLVLDTLLRVRYHGSVCAVDLEAEARPRATIGRRCFEYGARASIVTGLPVFSVVVWLEAAGTPPASPYELRVAERLLETWHFVGIPLYALPATEVLARGLVGLLPLVPFTQGGADVRVVEAAAQGIRDRAPRTDVDELAALLAVFAARTLPSEVIRSLMRRLLMSTEIIEQSAFYQEALAKGRAAGIEQGVQQGIEQGVQQGIEQGVQQGIEQGVQQGIEQGVQQGIEQGVQQGIGQGIERGVREAVGVALRGRFGELPQDVHAALATASLPALERVLAHLTSETLDELRTRLTQ